MVLKISWIFYVFFFFVLGQMAPYTLGPKLNYVKEK